MGKVENDILSSPLGEEALNAEAIVTDLWSVRTLEEALQKFGHDPGSRIPRRDQIDIYDRVYEAFSAKKSEAIAAGRFEQVLQLHGTLCDLKRRFQELQLEDVREDHARQRRLYRAAQKELLNKGAQAMRSREECVEQLCAEREAELDRLHSAQRETLGLELSWLPEPRVKNTKRFLELQLAKTGLLRLHEYNEAHKVYKILSKLQSLEEKAFLETHNAKKAMKMRTLEERQAQDEGRLKEALTDYRARKKRERARLMQNLKGKLEHSERSMTHAHHMALLRRPELSQKPSAHWQKRANFSTSASALRGEQLTRAVKGFANGGAVGVADLTSMHDFSRPLDGSITTYGGPSLVSTSPSETSPCG